MLPSQFFADVSIFNKNTGFFVFFVLSPNTRKQCQVNTMQFYIILTLTKNSKILSGSLDKNIIT